MLKSNLFKDYIYPMAVFAGGMIGVGFLSLPYIALHSNIWLVFFYFILLTALVIGINLIFCEISLKTPDFKRFPGFVGYYLGKWGGRFATVSLIFGYLGAFLAYLIVGGQFLTSILQPIFSGSVLSYTLIYFVAVAIIIYFDITIISKVEFWIISLLFLSLFFIFIEGFYKITLSNIFLQNSHLGFKVFLLPYGPLLFALWGTGMIPETEEMLKGKKKNLKKIVTLSTLLVALFYLLFMILILGITGSQTTQLALTGVKSILGDGFSLTAMLFGALATFTAFIAGGITLKKTLIFDLRIKKWHAFVITMFTPLILFLIGLNSFIPLISFIGGVLLSINGVLILLMYKKVGGKNIIIYPLSFIFLLGLIYELIYFIK